MDKKCILPWIHFSVGINGDVVPCSVANNNEPLGNIQTHTIKEIWNNDRYVKLRNQMINGEEPESCTNCYNQEKHGGHSKRLRENKLWSKYWHLADNPTPDFRIPYIHIEFSNVCNFKCRTCNPSTSHSIAVEWKQLNWPLPHKEILHVVPNYWNDIKENIMHIEEIYFIGGEPMLMDEHYQLLQMLIDAGNFDVRLRYNSNVSKLKLKHHNVLDYWKHFKNISVHASLDGVAGEIEYIRHGAKWLEILENLKIITALPNMHFRISCCVSVFNVLRLHDIYKKYIELGFIGPDDFGANVLVNPDYYSIQSLHPDLKKQVKQNIEELLSSVAMNEMATSNFKYLINFMYEQDTYLEHQYKFKEITTALDTHRGEDLLTTFPELESQLL